MESKTNYNNKSLAINCTTQKENKHSRQGRQFLRNS